MSHLNKNVRFLLTLNRNKFYYSKKAEEPSEPPKSFDSIPGPCSLPLIGTLYLYLPLIGRYNFEKIHKNGLKNYERYGPVVREDIFPGQTIVWLFELSDIEKMFRSEGQIPMRLSHLILEKYRLDRPYMYNNGGLLPTNGPEWVRIRKALQKGLSSPEDALTFVKGSDRIMQEWMDVRLEQLRSKPNVDYLSELSRLFLEFLGFAVFDTRFLSFYDHELPPHSKSSRILKAALVSNSSVLKTDHGPRLWRKFETPTYKKLKKAQQFLESEAIDLIAHKISTFQEKKEDDSLTLLEKYFKNEALDFKDLIGAACDFFLAGMDTTTYTTSFMLYHLAKNPEVQEALYEETCQLLPNPTDPITPKIYINAEYAKCVLKESLRLSPVAIGVGRLTTQNVVFSGYMVPKGTVVVSGNQVICRMEKYFKDPLEFKPLRWHRCIPTEQKINPYLSVPFGVGQRSCIARRFAQENMTILMMKLVRNYKIGWAGSDIDSRSLLINKPDGPIMLTFEKR